jgi:hypothetical protein
LTFTQLQQKLLLSELTLHEGADGFFTAVQPDAVANLREEIALACEYLCARGVLQADAHWPQSVREGAPADVLVLQLWSLLHERSYISTHKRMAVCADTWQRRPQCEKSASASQS